jgi:hypothetical protein
MEENGKSVVAADVLSGSTVGRDQIPGISP